MLPQTEMDENMVVFSFHNFGKYGTGGVNSDDGTNLARHNVRPTALGHSYVLANQIKEIEMIETILAGMKEKLRALQTSKRY